MDTSIQDPYLQKLTDYCIHLYVLLQDIQPDFTGTVIRYFASLVRSIIFYLHTKQYMDWINTLPNISQKIRTQLHSRNMCSVQQLNRFLGSTLPALQLDHHDFNKFLNKIGIFLKTQELRKVFEKFDLDKNGLVHRKEFIEVLKTDCSQQRKTLIRDVWNCLSYHKEKIPLEEFMKKFNASMHPLVLSRRLTPSQIEKESYQTLAQYASQGHVDENTFLNYCLEINAVCSSVEQQFFTQILKNAWGFEYWQKQRDVRCKELEAIIYEKVREKTKTLSDESFTTNSAFRYFDLDDLKRTDFRHFKKALERFGCVFKDSEMMDLFIKYDIDGSGYLQYNEIAEFFFKIGCGKVADSPMQFELLPKTLYRNKFR